MALVSYGNSDEDSDITASDEEGEVVISERKKKEDLMGNDNDDDDQDIYLPAKPLSLSLPSPRHSAPIKSDDSDDNSDEGIMQTSDVGRGRITLANLPKPKSENGGHKSTVEVKECELEDFVKRKFEDGNDSGEKQVTKKRREGDDDVTGVKTTTASKETGSKKKQKAEKIRITVPSIHDYNSSDSDDDTSDNSKLTSSNKKGSSLCDILPTPVNITAKQSNRSLIPHTLTKKTNTATSSSKKVAMIKSSPLVKPSSPSAVTKVVDELSDHDDDGDSMGDFFSLASNSVVPPSLPPASLTSSSLPPSSTLTPASLTSSSLPPPSLPPSSTLTPASVTSSLSSSSLRGIPDESMYTGVSSAISAQRQNHQNAPLQFKASSRAVHQQQPHHQEHHHRQHHSEELAVGPYPPPLRAEGMQYPAPSHQAHSSVDSDLDKEQLMRLAGNRGQMKKKGMEEINFLEVSADDALSDRPRDWLERSVNEELQGEKPASSKKSNSFSGVAKSRHQLTYLAFQAREREIELKNQWANNRQTKRETQSKYGF